MHKKTTRFTRTHSPAKGKAVVFAQNKNIICNGDTSCIETSNNDIINNNIHLKK